MSEKSPGAICICRDRPDDDPSWEPEAWATHPDALGCPKHRPIKQYCRIHHNGFYGDCLPCQLRSPIAETAPSEGDLDGSPAVSPEDQVKSIVAGLIDELS